MVGQLSKQSFFTNTKLENTVKKHKTVKVELFATGLNNPTHMEWTLDGRLLVSEHTAGQVKDITQGGDMRNVKPFASGLQGPTSILPLKDGRILISQTWSGEVAEISRGGDISKYEPFADGLSTPYSLACTYRKDASERITISERFGLFRTQITDITKGGGRDNFRPYVQNLPSMVGAPGLTPIEVWPEKWEDFAAAGCVTSWQTPYIDSLLVVIAATGQILKVPQGGGEYFDLVDRNYLIAWGLQRIGGIILHPNNGLVYAVQPEHGSVVAINPEARQNYRFEPPVVQGLNTPTCPRFSPDGETMFVCGSGEGAIWKVTNFSR